MAENIHWTRGYSFHPDIGEAYQRYRQGDKDAFKKAVQGHKDKAVRGERIVEGDGREDQALIDMIQIRTQRYIQRTGDRPPESKIKEKNLAKKRHWTDIPLGLRSYPEDEG